MIFGWQVNEEALEQNYQWFFTIYFSLVWCLGRSVNNVLLTLSSLLNKHPTFIEGTFISVAVVQRLSLLHGSAK